MSELFCTGFVLKTTHDNGSGMRFGILHKVADGSEGSTFTVGTITGGNSHYKLCVCAVFSGGTNTDVFGSTAAITNFNTTNPITATGVTATAKGILIGYVGVADSTGSIPAITSSGSVMTPRIFINGSDANVGSLALFTQPIAAAGATGNRTFLSSSATTYNTKARLFNLK
jgi:hypothetical protein